MADTTRNAEMPALPIEIHIAGLPVLIGSHHRQRCAWCGAVIDDVDLRNVSMLLNDDGSAPEYASWVVGSLVANQGGASWTVEHTDGADVPAGCCANLDPRITR